MFGQCSAKLGTLQTNSNNFGQLQASSNPFYWQERLALQVTYTPLGREETLSWETESLEKQDFLISCQSLGTQFLNAWCLMVHGSWLKAHGSWPRGAGPALGPEGAPGPPGSGPGAPSGTRAGPAPLGHEPWAMSLESWAIKHASSIKHQASVLSPINTPRQLKHFWPDSSRSFFGARLFQLFRFPSFQISRSEILKCWVSERPIYNRERPIAIGNAQSMAENAQ